ncbi:MAG: sterol desaturase family protein [Bacteroidetes bacterium]|nr:sterol desaturase family protein [Bacteroidota bacterium]
MSTIQSFVKRYAIGKGIVSGYISVFLSLLAFGGLMCFYFPEIFTTPEFREVYTAKSMKMLLTLTIIVALLFGLSNVLLSTERKRGILGIFIASVTIVIGGFDVQGRAVEKVNWHLGLDWLLLDLLLMAIIFIPIEMIFPKREEQDRFHTEWRTDLIYFAISHLCIQFFGVITQEPAVVFFGKMNLEAFQFWIQSLPLAVEIFLAFFITDVFQYWAHRIFHSNFYLWRFHAVHHSTKTMDWLAGSRTHFIDIFFTRSITFIPLYVCGFSPLVFNVYIVVIAIHAVFIHANTRLNIGLLKYLFTTPQYHHWHHCVEEDKYGKNFAVFFPFIDRIFGTYYLPENEWPKGTGLNEAQFPKGYTKQLVYPFKNNPFDNQLGEGKESSR